MRINEPDINLAIYERPAPQGVVEFLKGKTRSHLEWPGVFPGEKSVQETRYYKLSHWFLPIDVYQQTSSKNPLVADAKSWLPLFKQLTGPSQSCGFRVCSRDEKPVYHKDPASLRLLIAYQGTGMRFLHNSDACRNPDSALYGGEFSARPGSRVYQVKTYAVVLVKGDLWHERRQDALVHRAVSVRRGAPRPRVLFVAHSSSCAL